MAAAENSITLGLTIILSFRRASGNLVFASGANLHVIICLPPRFRQASGPPVSPSGAPTPRPWVPTGAPGSPGLLFWI